MMPAALFSVACLVVMPGVLWAASAQCSRDSGQLYVIFYLTLSVEQGIKCKSVFCRANNLHLTKSHYLKSI